MGIELNKPLKWTNADDSELAMLVDLQGNILKGHGRAHTAHLFLNFEGPIDDVREVIRSIGRQTNSALDQLNDVAAFKQTKISAGKFLAFFLTKKGYDTLEVPLELQPDDAAFQSGMRASHEKLSDPAITKYDDKFKQLESENFIHGMLMIAHDSQELVKAEASRWKALLSFGGVVVLDEPEIGHQHFNAAGEGIENFGYVDGRSQPLMLVEDIEAEAAAAGVVKDATGAFPWIWNPEFPLGQTLTPDRAGGDPATSFGSYFVFRKLEQNVKKFKDQEAEGKTGTTLADALSLSRPERERAGAMVVGRFEDGTPYVLPFEQSATSGASAGPVNNFNFSEDQDGKRCPFRAHIRKTNPRGESGLDDERDRIMARRAITYGERKQGPDLEFEDRPEAEVGLLFMAYMAKITGQFEVTQAFWANDKNFVKPNTGIDPVIGQTPGRSPDRTGPVMWPDGFGNPDKAEFDFEICVGMKGGEYFFAPSRSFLMELKAPPTASEDSAVSIT